MRIEGLQSQDSQGEKLAGIVGVFSRLMDSVNTFRGRGKETPQSFFDRGMATVGWLMNPHVDSHLQGLQEQIFQNDPENGATSNLQKLRNERKEFGNQARALGSELPTPDTFIIHAAEKSYGKTFAQEIASFRQAA